MQEEWRLNTARPAFSQRKYLLRMHRPRRSPVVLLLCCCAASACATAHPIDLTPKPAMDQRDVLEFRYRGQSIALESVRYTADSVTGIPWHSPADPRVGYLLKDVTNAKVYGTGKSADQGTRNALVVMGALFFALMGMLAYALRDY